MVIRTVCFGLAKIVVDGPMRWVFIAGAVFLPYVAVETFANAGRETGRSPGRWRRRRPRRRRTGPDGAPLSAGRRAHRPLTP